MKTIKFGLIVFGILLVVRANAQPKNCEDKVTPTFSFKHEYCKGDTPVLPDTSDNGIRGTWKPATINTASVGVTKYIFTPGAGECAFGDTVKVTISQGPDETKIVRKGSSNILICEDATDDARYQWGFTYLDESKEKKDSLKTSIYFRYQYFQFDAINTVKYKYFVEIRYGLYGCPTRTFYDPPPPITGETEIYSTTSKITAYPNPAKHHLSFTFDRDIKGSFTVLLLNSFGQTVLSKQYAEYQKNETLNVDFNLPTGIYVLTVRTKDEVLTSKIVIE